MGIGNYLMPQRRSKPKDHRKRSGLGASLVRSGCSVAGRLWMERDGKTVLSWGRIVLLERIRDFGSLSAAARSMGMGYRHAWELVEEMNALSPRELVTKAVGGRQGGGAALTPAGERAIANFWKLVAEFRTWIAKRDPRLWRDLDAT